MIGFGSRLENPLATTAEVKSKKKRRGEKHHHNQFKLCFPSPGEKIILLSLERSGEEKRGGGREQTNKQPLVKKTRKKGFDQSFFFPQNIRSQMGLQG
jgi:hypothetical protein